VVGCCVLTMGGCGGGAVYWPWVGVVGCCVLTMGGVWGWCVLTMGGWWVSCSDHWWMVGVLCIDHGRVWCGCHILSIDRWMYGWFYTNNNRWLWVWVLFTDCWLVECCVQSMCWVSVRGPNHGWLGCGCDLLTMGLGCLCLILTIGGWRHGVSCCVALWSTQGQLVKPFQVLRVRYRLLI